jgi:hypothetical protein
LGLGSENHRERARHDEKRYSEARRAARLLRRAGNGPRSEKDFAQEFDTNDAFDTDDAQVVGGGTTNFAEEILNLWPNPTNKSCTSLALALAGGDNACTKTCADLKLPGKAVPKGQERKWRRSEREPPNSAALSTFF